MTTTEPEQTDPARRPMKMTDPRDHGLSRELFERDFIECGVLGGITRREYCHADSCSDYGGPERPLAGDDEHACADEEACASADAADATEEAARAPEGLLDECVKDLAEHREEVLPGPTDRGDVPESATASEAIGTGAPAAPTNDDGARLVKQDEQGDAYCIECGVLGIRIEREYCASECAHRQESICPRNAQSTASESSDSVATAPAPAEQPGVAAGETTDDGDAREEPTDCEEERLDDQEKPGEVLELPAPDLLDADAVVAPVMPVQVDTGADDSPNLWIEILHEAGEASTVGAAADATPEHIEAWHLRTGSLYRTTVVHACLVGLALIARKALLRHGEFQSWIEKNCTFSYPTAATYMRVAKKLRQNYGTPYFCLSERSIRGLERALPSPGKKMTNSKKGDTETPTPTSPTVTSSQADTDDSPLSIIAPPAEGPQTDADTPVDVNDHGDTGQVTVEVDSQGEVDASGETGKTMSEDQPGTDEQSAAGVTADERKQLEYIDVEMAVVALENALRASSTQKRLFREIIMRLTRVVGRNASMKPWPLALPSPTSSEARTPPRPRGKVTRWKDLQSEAPAGSAAEVSG